MMAFRLACFGLTIALFASGAAGWRPFPRSVPSRFRTSPSCSPTEDASRRARGVSVLTNRNFRSDTPAPATAPRTALPSQVSRVTAARPAPAKNESRKRAPPSGYSAHTSGVPTTFCNAFRLRSATPLSTHIQSRNVLRVVCNAGGIVVASKLVLWSPVGAPAGVPGPRRNADDCDAGWFAPVATRRRSIFSAFQAPSPWLAVSPGGRPPEPPDGPPAPQAFTCGPGSGRHPCGPEGRLRAPGPVSCRAPRPPDSPPASPLSLRHEPSRCCVRTTLSQLTRPQPSAWHGPDRRWNLQPVTSVRRNQAQRRPEVAWARSSVRAQAILRPPPRLSPKHHAQPAGGLAGHGVLSVPG